MLSLPDDAKRRLAAWRRFLIACAPNRCRFALTLGLLLASLAATSPARAFDWLPLSPEEVAMTSVPEAPNVPAVYLYRQVDRNDDIGSEFEYRRIKILTEEGRKYADVSVEYIPYVTRVRSIQARVIHPDGRIVNFDGKVYEQTLIKAHGAKVMAKTFTLPDVQVGSIIEYCYWYELPEYYVYNSHWLLNDDLFTKHAKFSLVRNRTLSLTWSWPLGLPAGASRPASDHGVIRLEVNNVPAFVTEESMPPENALKLRVDFVYSSADERADSDPKMYWKHYGQNAYRRTTKFIDERRAMERAVAETVEAGDAPEVKLRKLYERVQRLRNLTYERERTDDEIKREGLKDNHDVEDVWTRGYGTRPQLAWLFLALVRAAGFTADPVEVSSRDQYFFSTEMMNSRELNTTVVRVKLGDKDLFLDPGTQFAPFGLLRWFKTAVRGLCLDKDGGTWVSTPAQPAAESRIERKADLTLTEGGSLEGKVTVTYHGLEALERRVSERNEDAESHKQYLENELQRTIPAGSNVTLTNMPDWNSSSLTMVAEFDVSVPGFATAAGSRELLQTGIFGGLERHAFEHGARVHPIYFHFPYEEGDDIDVALPPGLKPSSLPKPVDVDLTGVAYKNNVERAGEKLHLTRYLAVRTMFTPVKDYGAIYGFYQQVRAADDQQVVLSRAKPPATR